MARFLVAGFFRVAFVLEVPAFSPVSLGLRARSTEARRASMRSTAPVAFGAGSVFSTVSPACLASMRAATFSW
ncbi:hypothetical protein AB0B78_19500 [Streptomyces sp. NPDC040724]|uniref:hypothetical protein n=1 Tax=Streptomyces sp. NPDC040724 TaxID=3155612 RepID=UPI0033DE1C66